MEKEARVVEEEARVVEEEASIDSQEDTGTKSKSIAVVSGKGGSGKTMVAAVIAEILSFDKPTIIVDADTGTGGMTYYLGLKLVHNIRVGLSNVAIALEERPPPSKPNPEPIDDSLVLRNLQPILSSETVGSQSLENGRFGKFGDAEFLGVGDHRLLYRLIDEERFPSVLSHVVRSLRRERDGWIVVDCRGGIDRESVAVCREVEDIVLISELDTTSIQATQHVADTLSEHDLAHKVRGFIINKVIDDPKSVVRSGTSVYGAQYLSSIPFDFEATRAFLVGEVPKMHSLFGVHVWQAMSRAYPDNVPSPPPGRVWNFEDFRNVGLTSIESVRGGIVTAGLILLLGVTLVFASYFFEGLEYLRSTTVVYVLIVLFLLGLIGSIEPTRRVVGRAMDLYLKAAERLLGGRSH